MPRTFVRVELEYVTEERAFATAMAKRGFRRTVTGKTRRKELRLPDGMYLIERTTPAEALELARDAARDSNVRARICCMPVDRDIRFSNLLRD